MSRAIAEQTEYVKKVKSKRICRWTKRICTFFLESQRIENRDVKRQSVSLCYFLFELTKNVLNRINFKWRKFDQWIWFYSIQYRRIRWKYAFRSIHSSRVENGSVDCGEISSWRLAFTRTWFNYFNCGWSEEMRSFRSIKKVVSTWSRFSSSDDE